jgi:RNA polymerase sigma-70 factor (TIGR02957 family)
MTNATDIFEAHRQLLFSVAYRILGAVAEAEDAVQDCWLRWSRVDTSTVEHPKAYLVRITTNTALNRLRSAQSRRESYVGPWLPEPIVTSPDVADVVETTESVSLAMLVVLETLGPEERAVFVLREVFGFPHAEIAAILDRSETSVRQLAHRARSHVRARRPRFDTDPAQQKEAAERFMSAATNGDINELMKILAPDVTVWTDGGGKVRAAINPIHGRDNAIRFMLGITTRPWQGVAIDRISFTLVRLNDAVSALACDGHRVLATITPDIADGKITEVRVVANPDKLRHLTRTSKPDA